MGSLCFHFGYVFLSLRRSFAPETIAFMKKLLSLLLILCTVTVSAQKLSTFDKTDPKNQDTTNSAFGKGIIHKYGEDSTWYAKVSFRFQTQFQSVLSDIDNIDKENYADRFRVRRARIKGSGWATKGRKLGYKFEYDVHNGFVLDAVVKWNFAKNWEIWFGQTKLPGNIERVISSQKLQFVDRSLLNSRFTLDRDAGVQLRNKHTVGDNFVIKEKFAFSQGEGLNATTFSNSHGYTARLELFPFGTFDEYVSSDLKYTQTGKLMVAATYDYNADAARARGQLGSTILFGTEDLQTLFVDVHYKLKGWSYMLEYVNKTTTTGIPVTNGVFDAAGNLTAVNETYFTGDAINMTLGKLVCRKSGHPWEVALRYTEVNPEAITQNPTEQQYGLAVSKYIVGHNLKVQSDINILQVEGRPDQAMFRLQTEFNF